jgi:hypothetical protein
MERVEQAGRLIIGLGGTGGQYVNAVAESLTKFSVEGAPGISKSQIFIAIDSNPVALQKLGYINVENRIHIPPPQVGELLKRINPWLPKDLAEIAFGEGSGNKRAFGKALYNTYKGSIFSQLNKKLDDMANFIGSSNFLVVLISSFGGGTGAGMLIDLAIDIRDAVHQNYGQDPFILGIGILPMSGESNINKSNAMAAIKELHFLMNNSKDVQVNNKKYDNPFKLFFLLSREINNVVRDDEILEATQRFLVDLGFVPNKYVDSAIKGHRLDLSDFLTRVKDSRNKFSTLGFYQVYLPIQELQWLFESEAIVSDLSKKLNDYESSKDVLTKQVADIKKEKEELQNFIEKTLKASSTYESEHRIYQRMHKQLLDKKDDLQKSFSTLTDEHNRSISKLENDIADLNKMIIDTQNNIDNITKLMNSTRNNISVGKSTPTYRQIELRDSDINKIQSSKIDTKKSNFYEQMKSFDRLEEYFRFTHEDVSNLNITLDPLLNYKHFKEKSRINPDVLRYLIDVGAAPTDRDGVGTLDEAKLGYMMAVVSSNPDNIHMDRLALTQFENLTKRNLAQDSDLLSVPTPARNYTFAEYWLMSGIHISSLVPGEEPRLQDLVHLSEAYNRSKEMNWVDVLKSHAFLYGEPSALAKLRNDQWSGVTPEEGAQYVTKFWQDYEPVDEEAVITQSKIGIANTVVHSQNLTKSIAGVEDSYGLISKITNMEVNRQNLSDFTSRITVCRNELDKSLNLFLSSIDDLDRDLAVMKDLSSMLSRIRTIKTDQSTVLGKELSQLREIAGQLDTQCAQTEDKIQEMMESVMQLKPMVKTAVTTAVKRIEVEADLDRISVVLERVNSRQPHLQELIVAKMRLTDSLDNQLKQMSRI